jgi:hypothetical protein
MNVPSFAGNSYLRAGYPLERIGCPMAIFQHGGEPAVCLIRQVVAGIAEGTLQDFIVDSVLSFQRKENVCRKETGIRTCK